MNETLKVMGHHLGKFAAGEHTVMEDLCSSFNGSRVPLPQRLQNFPRHVRRQDMARLLVRHEIFKQSLSAHGSIVECGVRAGGGLMSWAHFSAIHEPYNHTRRVIGFDTFAGFPEMHEQDLVSGAGEHSHKGGLNTHEGIVAELQQLIAVHDRNRPLGHIPKIQLVVGDACETIPKYLEDHAHLLISLLYLDFDIYAPTKVALEKLFPRVVKGGVVAFDELSHDEFPGETVALLDTLDLREVELKRLPFDPYISFFVK